MSHPCGRPFTFVCAQEVEQLFRIGTSGFVTRSILPSASFSRSVLRITLVYVDAAQFNVNAYNTTEMKIIKKINLSLQLLAEGGENFVE